MNRDCLAPLFNPEVSGDVLISVRIVNEGMQEVRKENIVGICHSTLHPGVLTKKHLESHNCLGKGCDGFEKCEGAVYWAELEAKRLRKEEIKREKKAQKMQQRKHEKLLRGVKRNCQKHINEAGYVMDIIRVEQIGRNYYKLFYVSEHPFADWNRFPKFLDAVKKEYPTRRLYLQHIKDIDGHFVTCAEFHRRRKS